MFGLEEYKRIADAQELINYFRIYNEICVILRDPEETKCRKKYYKLLIEKLKI